MVEKGEDRGVGDWVGIRREGFGRKGYGFSG